MKALRSSFRKLVNGVLAPFELEVVRRGHGAFANYVPFRATLAGAKAAGVKVGDYIDATYNKPGATQQTIAEMTRLCVFDRPVDHICELGPGSGRYLEQVLANCQPRAYEVYETARDWRDWLARTYRVTAHPADGASLACTPTASVGLMHAHKVLPGLPIFVACRYIKEMARVVRPNGKLVFDILTEQCLSDTYIANWLASHAWPQSMFPKDFVVAFLARRGIAFVGSFVIPMSPDITEYVVFQRIAPHPAAHRGAERRAEALA